jgi:hypothetical protein
MWLGQIREPWNCLLGRSHIYRDLEPYVDSAAKYAGACTEFDLEPAEIKSKTIHLAIPELTWPKQRPYLFRAILYDKENGVTLRITSIRG